MVFYVSLLFICLANLVNSGQPYTQDQVWGKVDVNCPTNEFECKSGQCIDKIKICNRVRDCTDGSDEVMCDHYSKNNMSCMPLVSVDVTIRCWFNDKDVPCFNNVPPGTIAEMDCKLFHKSLASTTVRYNYCQQNGYWLYPIPDCSLIDCQIHTDLNENATVNETGAESTKLYPWQAVIYRRDGDNLKSTAFGTLISEYAVITDVSGPYGTYYADVYSPLNVTTVVVAFGQQYYSISDPRNKDIQYYEVEFVHLFSDYLPTHSRICVIELKKPVQFSHKLMPACLDVNRKYTITDEAVYGSTVGWSPDNTTLTEQMLPYIPRLDCYNYMRATDFDASNKHDNEQEEYCAGLRNGTLIDTKMRNSGTGFMYKFDFRYFLFGVAKSILGLNVNGSTNEIFVFNDVRNDFILDFINSTTENIRMKHYRTCKPILQTYSLAAECTYGSKNVPCGENMRPGAMAKLRCAEGYNPISPKVMFHNYCKEDGQWLYQLPECTHDCGTIDSEVTLSEDESNRVSSPWFVTMYFWRESRYVFACSGTLVSPTAVLSVLECSDPSGAGRINSTAFKLAIGKRFIFFLDTRDVEAQHFDVEHIYTKENVDLAIFELRTLANINKYVKPACLDLNNKYKRDKSSVGNVLIWDYFYNKPDSIELLNYTYPYLTYKECKQLNSEIERIITDDGFCGLHNNTEESRKEGAYLTERGCGGTFMFDGRFYLYGVLKFLYKQVSTSETPDPNLKSVFRFVDITSQQAVDFINSTLYNITKKRSVPINKCIVPTSLGTKYSRTPCASYDDCKEIPTVEFIDQFTLIHINCMPGYTLAQDGYSFATCNKGRWQPERTACVRLCPPLVSKSTWSHCQYEGKDVRCDQNVRPGTVAVSDCSTGYISNDAQYFYNNTCLENGEWLKPYQQCNHTCGIVETSRPLIQDGKVANRTNHPWNTAVYYRFEDNSIQHICGGTLITPHSVLSAAHCVYDQKTRKKQPNTKFLLGFGKEHRSYQHPDDKTAQYSEVLEIHIPNFFDGRSINFLFDIAIFELKDYLKLSKIILPACIDATNEFSLTPNSMGIVAGWGYDNTLESGKPNELLHEATLPFISHQECLLYLKKSERGILTKDKFCAFYTNGTTTTVRSGDSGGGLIFEFNKRYYLFGLVSTQIHSLVSTFTDVKIPLHLDFITKTVQTITRKHYNLPHIIKGPEIPNTQCLVN